MTLLAIALAAGAAIPPLQIIADPIYSDPAPVWEISCGLVDDREPAPALRGRAYYSTGPNAPAECDPAALHQETVELDPAEQRAFEEAVDIARFPRRARR